LTSRSALRTIIHIMRMMIECCCHSFLLFSWLLFETFYFYSCFWIFVIFYTLFTLYPFETKKGSILIFGPGLYFYTSQVIFVLEWPNGEFVSFVGFILLTKSLSCNVAVLTGISYHFRIIKYSEIISLIWKRAYYDKFLCHKLQEGNFRVPGRFCEVSNSAKVGSLVPFRMVQ
jgi:hypothetical protein